jgi:membrane-associated phospholipid phosphatase
MQMARQAGGSLSVALAFISDPSRDFIRRWRSIRATPAAISLSDWRALAIAVLAILATAYFLDPIVARGVRYLPQVARDVFGVITHIGRSGYIFALSAFTVVVALWLREQRQGASQAERRIADGILAGRAFFIFAVCAVSGLASQIMKLPIGRARPFLADKYGAYSFHPFVFDARFASFPSGHTITAFAMAVALGWFLPKWRIALYTVAVLVAISRLVLESHYLADVLAGALVGTLSAIILRRMFAARRIVFEPDGSAIRVRSIGEPYAMQATGLQVVGMREIGFEESDPREHPVLSVVVPVRNEVGNVATLVGEIAKAVTPLGPFEIIYVNDGSFDGTGDELTGQRARYPQLRQIDHTASCGQSAAIRTGVRAARASIVCTLDGDGQNDPIYIPQLYRKLQEAGDACGLVQGQRVGRKATAFKKMQSHIANAVRSWFLQDGTRDTGCGLKCFRRDVYMELPYFDALHRFMAALVRREGFDIAYVNVVDRERLSGVSNYGFFDRIWIGILDLFGVRWLIRRRRRVPRFHQVSEEVSKEVAKETSRESA